ncbi:MAG: transglutaminase domain-containing protein [Firmicutes bacterium]|nr:transglutaminase domain-containing protein [Bacillota bacterium]
MKRCLLAALLLALTLAGCSWTNAAYHAVTPYEEQTAQTDDQVVSVTNYSQLCQALENLIEGGGESQVFSVAQYAREWDNSEITSAIAQVLRENPIAAYAVDTVEFEEGTSGGQAAVAVSVSYVHDRTEILKIKHVADIDAAKEAIAQELEDCAAGTVLYLSHYEDVDLVQFVEDYALLYPQYVMETPEVTVNLYPETGEERVVELKFTYQTSRDALRTMQTQVRTVFTSAVLYVSGDAADQEKFSQLYSFLMERYDYQLDTSITPAYHLLRHGVGDAKAFATVYAAMCREAGLDCQTITGTRWGEPWSWNLVCDSGTYYYVDLLRCSGEGGFTEMTQEQMEGYVWDYSAYPGQETTEATEGTEATDSTEATENAEATENTEDAESTEST